MSRVIVLEGVDGVGKSTQFELLKGFFFKKGITCKALHFPTKEVDVNYLSSLSIRDVVDYYLNDMYDTFSGPLSGCKEDIILLDRYYYSTFAYQGAFLSHEKLETLEGYITDKLKSLGLPKPDLSLYLNLYECYSTFFNCRSPGLGETPEMYFLRNVMVKFQFLKQERGCFITHLGGLKSVVCTSCTQGFASCFLEQYRIPRESVHAEILKLVENNVLSRHPLGNISVN